MANGYTDNLQLCQWAGTDYFLREEFNSDNQKIDAAFAELNNLLETNGKVKLFEETVDEGIDTIHFDLSEIDFCTYETIILDVDATGSTNNTSVFVRINGEDSNSLVIGTTSWNNTGLFNNTMGKGNCKARIFLLPFKGFFGTGEKTASIVFSTEYKMMYGESTISPDNITFIEFTTKNAEENFSYAKLTVWGKK